MGSVYYNCSCYMKYPNIHKKPNKPGSCWKCVDRYIPVICDDKSRKKRTYCRMILTFEEWKAWKEWAEREEAKDAEKTSLPL